MMEGPGMSVVSVLFCMVSVIITAVSSSEKCDGSNSTPSSTESYTVSIGHSRNPECCKVDYEDSGFTVTHFPCQSGCCGDRENQYCCSTSSSDRLPYVIGGSIAGVLVFIGFVLLMCWGCGKTCRKISEESTHKKLLKEVYLAETVDELFLPSQPLVSAPGTIIHPLTNVNGPFYTMDATSYVMPDLNQPQVMPQPPPTQRNNNEDIDDDNEENWTRWDGFPESADHIGISAISGEQSAGRGRDNPFYQGEGEGGAEGGSAYYYERYDKYSQPPPGYEEVTDE